MDESVYVNHIYHPCEMWWYHVHHMWLNVACNFTYTTNEILIVHVDCNLFLSANYNRKLRPFFFP
jgi:hypothetical protein